MTDKFFWIKFTLIECLHIFLNNFHVFSFSSNAGV
jgi:hypothetical protein